VFVAEILGYGYVIIGPSQFFVFDSSLEFMRTGQSISNWNTGIDKSLVINYRILGHSPLFQVKAGQMPT
jgi:hypothetical protein